MTSTSSSPLLDVPFIVRDRRRKGFFTIDNALLDRYGAQLKAHGLAVYMALARFANHDGTCWPSLATIAKRTGMSRMQVIRELAKLQELGLIAVEHQYGAKGEHRANLYILLDIAEVVTDSDQGSHRQLQGVVTESDHPSHRALPKQDLTNKTQEQNQTQRTTPRANTTNSSATATHPSAVGGADSDSSTSPLTPKPRTQLEKTTDHPLSVVVSPLPNSGEPPSPTLERQQTGASALIAIGMTAKVAERLAERYSLVRIEEKLGHLDFLQAHEPDKVKNPCGWLRKAIEDDFAAPDGYHAPADEAAQLAATLALADQLLESPKPAAKRASVEAGVVHLQVQYGTTEEDHRIWQQTVREFDGLGRAYLSDLLAKACILHVTDDTALIGVQDPFQRDQLQHPQTKLVIGRTLTQIAGRPLTPEFVVLQEKGEPREGMV